MESQTRKDEETDAGKPLITVSEDANPYVRYVVDNFRYIAVAAALLVAAAAVYSGVSYYQARVVRNAQDELGKVLTHKKGDDLINSLKALLDTSPSSMRPAIELEIVRVMFDSGKHADVMPYLNDLEKAGEVNVQTLSKLGKASVFSLEGKYPEALEVLEALASGAPEAYLVAVNQQLAFVAEQAGKKDRALKAYADMKSKLEKDPGQQAYLDYKIAQLNATKQQ